METLTPNNEYVQDARAAGITSMLLIPGSGNNMAGFGTLIKSAGRTTDDIILRAPGVIKISQAGNPERYWYGVGRSFMYWNLRTTLEELKAYHEAWCAYEEGKVKEPPEVDPRMEKFRGLFRHEYGALVHTQGYQLMMNTTLQLWDYLGIWLVIGHGTFDGYKTAPLLAPRNMPVVAGPRNLWVDRHDRRINGVPAKYNEGGVETLGTNTDAPVLPIEEHFYQATLGVRLGWDDSYDALKGLTWVGARAGLIDHRVGSIEPGKDADLALFKGDPIDPRSPCVLTIVNGEVAYDAARDGQRY
jgi:imidazolonepropionase-like amidohydrolase